jgi:hypothetical protein
MSNNPLVNYDSESEEFLKPIVKSLYEHVEVA